MTLGVLVEGGQLGAEADLGGREAAQVVKQDRLEVVLGDAGGQVGLCAAASSKSGNPSSSGTPSAEARVPVTKPLAKLMSSCPARTRSSSPRSAAAPWCGG